jgi:hypothetical protein
MYCHALRERNQDQVAVLDTYYDKICRELWAEREWSSSYPESIHIRPRNRGPRLAPTADVIVAFELTEPVWRHFLQSRNRSLNKDWGVSRTFQIQDHFTAAAARLGK